MEETNVISIQMNDLQEPEDYDKVTEIRNEFGLYEVICYHETWFLSRHQ